MAGFFIKLAAFAVAIALQAGPVLADDKTYVAEFKAYQAAINSGDKDKALSHGLAAWQAAESELGDDRLTAILAYNYGQLAIYADPAKANAALSRAKELADAGLAELPMTDLELFLAYTALKLKKDGRSEANALRSQLEQIAEQNIPPNHETTKMWLELISADIRNRRYREVRNNAARVEEMVANVFPEDHRARATVIIFHGLSWLSAKPHREKNVITAIELFRRASSLFPPQESIENFDDLLAQAFIWEAASHAVYLTNGYNPKRIPESTAGDSLFAGEQMSLEECGGEWAERDPPKYPSKELFRGYVGAVLIGYHFGDDTSVHDVRILAEVPDRSFGEAVLKEVSNWKLTAPPPDDPRCRKNKIFWVTFVID